jgi:hypothetical protein
MKDRGWQAPPPNITPTPSWGGGGSRCLPAMSGRERPTRGCELCGGKWNHATMRVEANRCVLLLFRALKTYYYPDSVLS